MKTPIEELIYTLESLATWTNRTPCFCDQWKLNSMQHKKHTSECDHAFSIWEKYRPHPTPARTE